MSDSEDINTLEKFIDEIHHEIMERNVTNIKPSLLNASNIDTANNTGSEMSEIESESDIGHEPCQYKKGKRKRVHSQLV